MRNRLNVIQINGISGIVFVVFAAICLAAGFIVFPGLVLKVVWNFISAVTSAIPLIGSIQGVLLWGIVVVSYFAFKKRGFFVELKSADDLSRAEMDAVMHRIRAERQADIISRSILKARELDMKSRNEADVFIKENNTQETNSDITHTNAENSEAK